MLTIQREIVAGLVNPNGETVVALQPAALVHMHPRQSRFYSLLGLGLAETDSISKRRDRLSSCSTLAPMQTEVHLPEELVFCSRRSDFYGHHHHGHQACSLSYKRAGLLFLDH